VLAWRLHRHLLDPVGDVPVTEVVRRLCGVQAQVASSADLAIRLRRDRSGPGDVSRALADGRLIKTWAMRGTLHLLPAEDAPAFLSLVDGESLWRAWQRYLGLSDDQMDALRHAVVAVLADGPLTKVALAAAIESELGPGVAAESLRSSWGGILKPLAWRGDVCFGPSDGTRVTFTLPARASRRWPGIVERDAGACRAITAYVRAYGPATINSLAAWCAGSAYKRDLRRWFDEARTEMTEVEVGGEPAFVMADDLDELVATRPTTAVRLLPGFDQYVLGPGTKDPHVVPPARRAAVSRQAGWISPVVLAGGRVAGTWELDRTDVRIAWFPEAGRPPRRKVQAEVRRLSVVLDRDLRAVVTQA
jgi:hypothetical protein